LYASSFWRSVSRSPAKRSSFFCPPPLPPLLPPPQKPPQKPPLPPL
jgi:hypothetical protein